MGCFLHSHACMQCLNYPQEYLANENLAKFLGLNQVDTLHMPVPLSIVFIGFQGDGNLQVDIKDTELVEWFSAIDHDLPHIRVALSELSCSEDGKQEPAEIELVNMHMKFLRHCPGACSSCRLRPNMWLLGH